MKNAYISIFCLIVFLGCSGDSKEDSVEEKNIGPCGRLGRCMPVTTPSPNIDFDKRLESECMELPNDPLDFPDEQFRSCLEVEMQTPLTERLACQVTAMRCFNGIIDSSGIEKFINTKSLSLTNGRLSKIDIRNLLKLEFLDLGNNQIAELNLENLDRLITLHLSNNQLQRLEIKHLSNLKQLYAQGNPELDCNSVQLPNDIYQSVLYNCTWSFYPNIGNSIDPALTGKWETQDPFIVGSMITRYQDRIEFREDNSFIIEDLGESRYSGVDGNITFTVPYQSSYCDQKIGRYSYVVENGILNFSLIEDECGAFRSFFLVGRKWIKIE